MNTEPTLPQGGPERRRSQEKSLARVQPPAQVPGYDLKGLLGAGAYGEVWVAVQRNTGRRVAIKFYAHRGGLDWSLLSREVEKLAFLFADRHVVQLIGVGWDADPPYYIMEFAEGGSLADRLRSGPLAVEEAVSLFRDLAVGLVHAHGKGVLHCDLKPGNVLLDQDRRPRLADFGQSRLSHEQVPALGTLFYMAPEQASLKAVPDARWDVYALGALLYCMVTGGPPHKTEENIGRLQHAADLEKRLAVYRTIIRGAAAPVAHRSPRGVDRALAEVIDRCLAADPKKRYPNVQAVLDALDARDAHRARRPTMVLGAVGPALVLLVVSLFWFKGFSATLQRSNQELLHQALRSNHFAAQSVAKAVASGVDRRYRAVEQLVGDEALEQAFRQAVSDPELAGMLKRLRDPTAEEAELEPLRREFRRNPRRRALQAALEAAIPYEIASAENVNSWFLNDAHGVQIARVPEKAESATIGRDYAWRTYFHGGPVDRERSWRPAPGQHIDRTSLSAAYQSEATGLWNVAVSTPILASNTDGEKSFRGIGGLTVGVGKLVEFPGDDRQFAVLVERPLPGAPGHILQHPALEAMQNGGGRLPRQFADLRISVEQFPSTNARKAFYRDPLAEHDPKYGLRWLAETAGVFVGEEDTGWEVIVQESYASAIGVPLADLKSSLILYGLAALAMVVLVVLGLWGVAYRLLEESGRAGVGPGGGGDSETPGSGATSEAPTQTYRLPEGGPGS